jgi:hypothetical protein
MVYSFAHLHGRVNVDKDKLIELLNKMDIPEKRKDINLGNLSWLRRNIFIRNGNHPDIDTARRLINDLLNKKIE